VIRLAYLFDCKPRLIKLFFSISCSLHFYTLSKGLDDAKPFLGYVLSIKLSFLFIFSFYSLQHHVHIPSQEELWWTEGSFSGVSIITRVIKNAKRASKRMDVRSLGNLYLSAAYNRGRLTIE